MIACPACDRPNRVGRGYCGGCGATLAPVCRGCRFVNDDGDRFCGGCGNQLATPGVARATAPIEVAHDELAELLVAVPLAPIELPQNITQSDLDRLFGGGR